MDEYIKQINEIIQMTVDARKAGKIPNEEAANTIEELYTFKSQLENLPRILDMTRAHIAQKLEKS
jgi:hypothetical protein